MTAWSDVDFAVLCRESLLLDSRLRLVADATLALGRDVDVIDLLRAPLPVRGHVVREARPLLLADADAWCEFVTRVTVEWLDYQPLYERALALELARSHAPLRGASCPTRERPRTRRDPRSRAAYAI